MASLSSVGSVNQDFKVSHHKLEDGERVEIRLLVPLCVFKSDFVDSVLFWLAIEVTLENSCQQKGLYKPHLKQLSVCTKFILANTTSMDKKLKCMVMSHSSHLVFFLIMCP